ncbi:hypothetical protein HDU86_000288 [Geranomyces michiganensis]|nr:hypothetical protein HDU86_000288 [Geranomyces michiganensis]
MTAAEYAGESSTAEGTNPPAHAHTLIDRGPEKGIALHGWTITTCKVAIFNSAELDRAAEELSVPNPEMLFGNNHLTLTHETSGVHITFRAVDALKRVDASPNAAEGIKVAVASHWTKNNAEAAEKLKGVVKPYDWTYTTDYTGTLEHGVFEEAGRDDPGIDFERLKRPDPILFYDELVLYEDELADNGTAILTLRVRVMPTCFLVLLRFFLRVDGVMFRVNDTRLYHEFGTDRVIREYCSRDEDYNRIRGKIPKASPWGVRTAGKHGSAEDLSSLTDPNWVAAIMASSGPAEPNVKLASVADLRPGLPAPGKYLLVRETMTITPSTSYIANA